jgi:hypothetical protein
MTSESWAFNSDYRFLTVVVYGARRGLFSERGICPESGPRRDRLLGVTLSLSESERVERAT